MSHHLNTYMEGSGERGESLLNSDKSTEGAVSFHFLSFSRCSHACLLNLGWGQLSHLLLHLWNSSVTHVVDLEYTLSSHIYSKQIIWTQRCQSVSLPSITAAYLSMETWRKVKCSVHMDCLFNQTGNYRIMYYVNLF